MSQTGTAAPGQGLPEPIAFRTRPVNPYRRRLLWAGRRPGRQIAQRNQTTRTARPPELVSRSLPREPPPTVPGPRKRDHRTADDAVPDTTGTGSTEERRLRPKKRAPWSCSPGVPPHRPSKRTEAERPVPPPSVKTHGGRRGRYHHPVLGHVVHRSRPAAPRAANAPNT